MYSQWGRKEMGKKKCEYEKGCLLLLKGIFCC